MDKCCKCEDYNWPDPQKVVWIDPSDEKGYCVFHAPKKENKFAELDGQPLSADEFNERVYGRIDDQASSDFVGAVFPWGISFSRYDESNAMPYCDFEKAHFYSALSFDRVVFNAGVDLTETTFWDDVIFSGATIRNEAIFKGAAFSKGADFASTKFECEADFSGVAFFGEVRFSGDVTFGADATFAGATFHKELSFENATFLADAVFSTVVFSGKADFSGAEFFCTSSLSSALFVYEANFGNVIFESQVDFNGAQFKGSANFSSSIFSGLCKFEKCIFSNVANFESTSWNIAVFTFSKFGNIANFTWATIGTLLDLSDVESKESSVHLHQLKKDALGKINFTETVTEQELLSFEGCHQWPDTLKPEESEYGNYTACAHLYRLRKRVSERDKYMEKVSDWHHKEKLMNLKTLLDIKNGIKFLDKHEGKMCRCCAKAWTLLKTVNQTARKHCIENLDRFEDKDDTSTLWIKAKAWWALFWWSFLVPRVKLGLTGLYWFSSGFGEQPVRAFGFLFVLVLLPLLVFTLTALASTGLSCKPDLDVIAEVFKDWQRALPLSKIPLESEPSACKLWGFYLSQLAITIQAALFAMAVRNRFRR